MIDESQEINRKTSKDSRETNGSEHNLEQEDLSKKQQSEGGPHPDTPYPNHLINEPKSSNDLEKHV